MWFPKARTVLETIVAGALFLSLGVLTWWILIEGKPVEFTYTHHYLLSQPSNDQDSILIGEEMVYSGQLVYIYREYCRTRLNYTSYTIYIQDKNTGLRHTLRSIEAAASKLGCNKASFPLIIPNILSHNTDYEIIIVAKYRINPLRTIVEESRPIVFRVLE